MTIQETAALLQTVDRVLLLTHVRPDGDTIGSAAALCRALRDLGKTAYLLPNPGITETYESYAAPYWAEEGFTPDFVVAVDIAALSLLPENAKKYASCIDLAIDHHPSNEGFAKESCVLAEMAACGEIIYEIAGLMTPMTAEIALPLYVAVSTDTGCFVYANTTAHTHRVAADTPRRRGLPSAPPSARPSRPFCRPSTWWWANKWQTVSLLLTSLPGGPVWMCAPSCGAY